MKTIAELRAARAKKVAEFEALVAKMNADDYVETPEDKAAYDLLKGEVAGLDGEIAEAKAADDAKIARAAELNRVKMASLVPVIDKVPAQPKVRYSKLKNFKGPTAEEDAYRSGMFLRATLFGDDHAVEWCVEHGIVLTKAQGEGINTAGGFLVPLELERAIIDLREQFGVFRGQCRIYPMGSDSLAIPRRASGLTAYFVGENTAMTESQKGWDQVLLVAKKIAVLSRFSTELAEDAIISIADDLAQEIAYAFAVLEDSCGWNGDGTSAFGGIVGVRTKIIDGTHTKSAVNATTGHDLFSEIDNTDLTNLMAAVPKFALRNAKWYISQPGWATVFQRLAAAAGGNTMQTIAGQLGPSYLGYPIVIDQTLPTSTGTLVNVAMLFFGDLSLAVAMGDRRGIRIKQSDDRYFEFDQIGIQGTERIDLNVHDLGTTTVFGPLAGLIGA